MGNFQGAPDLRANQSTQNTFQQARHEDQGSVFVTFQTARHEEEGLLAAVQSATHEEKGRQAPLGNRVQSARHEEKLLLGAQMAAWIHGQLMFDGPATFVSNCLCTGLKLDGFDLNPCRQGLIRIFFEIIFLVIVPVSSPLLMKNIFLEYNLGAHQIDRNHVELENVVVHDSTQPGWVELKSQTTQGILSASTMQSLLGAATLLIFLFMAMIRHFYAKKLRLGSFAHAVGFLWLSRDYPRLRYTSRSSFILFGLPLYQIVPCVWAGVTITLMIVLPGFILFSAGITAMVRSVPMVMLATFSFGKLYMTAANISFYCWLGEHKCHAAVRRITQAFKVIDVLLELPEVIALTESDVEELVSHTCLEERFLEQVKETNCTRAGYYAVDAGVMSRSREEFIMNNGITLKVMILNDKQDAASYINLSYKSPKFGKYPMASSSPQLSYMSA